MKEPKKSKVVPRLRARRTIIKMSRSAWVLFSSEKRQTLTSIHRSKHPHLTDDKVFGAVCKDLAVMWKGMTLDDKAPYISGYKSDKLRYERELSELGEVEIAMLRQHRRNRRKKKKLMPPNSKSAYMLFVKHQRPTVVTDKPNLSFADVGRELGVRWNNMSEVEKKPYQDLAQLDRTRYLSELSAFRAAKLELKHTIKLEREAKLADKMIIQAAVDVLIV